MPRDEPINSPAVPARGLATAALFIAVVTILRVLYLAFLCPYELAADEAQYWDWSRPQHLDLSYYSKGPGIAWLIAASTRLLGDHEWAIRLPAALSIGLAMLALAELARRIAGPRAAIFAAALVCCIPAYNAAALLMTIDAPYLACWSLALLAAWRIGERSTLAAWAGFGAAIGVGFLFKYTILLLLPGLLVYWLFSRRTNQPARTLVGVLVAAAIIAALASPVLIWNAGHGWPTLAHLLGHLNAVGGDVTTSASRPYDPRWTLEFLGTQIGIVGPALLLFVLSTRRLARADLPGAARFALAAALPVLIFYFVVSFTTDVEGNWPIAGYLSLIIPAAALLARSRPLAGLQRAAWHWSIAFGFVSAIALMSLQWLDRVPGLTNAIPYHRLSGHRAYAERIAAEAAPHDVYIADQYTRAALLAYYLPGRPAVASATSYLGGRRSSYDFFLDTNLRDESRLGQTVVLIGATPEKWSGAFRFEAIEPIVPAEPKRPAVYLGRNFSGPVATP